MPIESDHRGSDSPYIARVWRGRTSGSGSLTSVATSNWELVFWNDEGTLHAAVRGPETTATAVELAGDSESFGITFAHGTSMPHLPVARLVDAEVESPHVGARRFVLRGEEWEIPGYESAEDFVREIVRAGVLTRDPLVDEVVWGGIAKVGTRSVQRRVATATGLTQGAIRQIDRARHAAVLLAEGVPALEVVHRLGYYDQPHLARSLRRFIGRTATQLQGRDEAGEPLSLLYKPEGDSRP
ncbi:helix-turn-helix domain-containing protein [Actinomadura madurae]|uniref:helix-turn-helix domain-containing protein n=1 Tax=Actinomadura madurae TaxID=1993 RepID=UPI0020270E00|nr:helix-turn-helix domain-containing protein [Actinomadura madurae]URM95977.1 helix-turn-helix domain-containing protein [Actinomadura madurae]URN06678.1 helix-turn-helix domain-containing protein [Actinomadura madurae]